MNINERIAVDYPITLVKSLIQSKKTKIRHVTASVGTITGKVTVKL